jgi:hypothetical protein
VEGIGVPGRCYRHCTVGAKPGITSRSRAGFHWFNCHHPYSKNDHNTRAARYPPESAHNLAQVNPLAHLMKIGRDDLAFSTRSNKVQTQRVKLRRVDG